MDAALVEIPIDGEVVEEMNYLDLLMMTQGGESCMRPSHHCRGVRAPSCMRRSTSPRSLMRPAVCQMISLSAPGLRPDGDDDDTQLGAREAGVVVMRYGNRRRGRSPACCLISSAANALVAMRFSFWIRLERTKLQLCLRRGRGCSD